MRRRARELTVAGKRPCLGVAIMVAASLLFAGTANATVAASPAGNAASGKRAHGHNAHELVTLPLVNRLSWPAPLRSATDAGTRYPHAFIEWKLSPWPPQHGG